MGCHSLFQGIFPTQGSNPGLPHCRRILYHLSHQSLFTDEETAWQSWVLNLGLSEVRNTLFGGWNQLSLQLSYFDYSFM